MSPVAVGTRRAYRGGMAKTAEPSRAQRKAAGKCLAQAREKAKLTQEQLGRKVDAEERTVRSWESGARPITERNVVALASVLRVDPAQLRWSSYASDEEVLMNAVAPTPNSTNGEKPMNNPPPSRTPLEAQLLAILADLAAAEKERAAGDHARGDAEKVRAEADKERQKNQVEIVALAKSLLPPRPLNGAGGGDEQAAAREGNGVSVEQTS